MAKTAEKKVAETTKKDFNLSVTQGEEGKSLHSCFGISDERNIELVDVFKKNNSKCDTLTQMIEIAGKEATNTNEIAYMMYVLGHAQGQQEAKESNLMMDLLKHMQESKG